MPCSCLSGTPSPRLNLPRDLVVLGLAHNVPMVQISPLLIRPPRNNPVGNLRRDSGEPLELIAARLVDIHRPLLAQTIKHALHHSLSITNRARGHMGRIVPDRIRAPRLVTTPRQPGHHQRNQEHVPHLSSTPDWMRSAGWPIFVGCPIRTRSGRVGCTIPKTADTPPPSAPRY